MAIRIDAAVFEYINLTVYEVFFEVLSLTLLLFIIGIIIRNKNILKLTRKMRRFCTNTAEDR